MVVQKAYKTEINPNNAQKTLLLKHAGAARWAYNWGITQKKLARENGGKAPSAIDLNRRIICMKAGELLWMREVSKCAPQEALRDLDRAFVNFFKKRARFPKFKSKKNGVGSFRLYGMIHIGDCAIQLPRIGNVRLKEKGYLPVGAKVISATASERSGRWFVSVLVEEEIPPYRGAKDAHDVVGVDFGIKALATVSDGVVHENPKPLKKCCSLLHGKSNSFSG